MKALGQSHNFERDVTRLSYVATHSPMSTLLLSGPGGISTQSASAI